MGKGELRLFLFFEVCKIAKKISGVMCKTTKLLKILKSILILKGQGAIVKI